MIKNPLVTVLYSNAGSISGPKLAKQLAKLGLFARYTDHYNEDYNQTDFLIRYGNTDYFPLKHGSVEINPAESIDLGSHKKNARRILQENGVSTPKTFFSKQEVLDLEDKQIPYPLFARQKHHTHGNGVEYITNRQELEDSNSAYYSEFLDKEREFRVYVVGFKAVHLAEKIPQDKSKKVWNTHKGAVINNIFDLENYKEIVDEGVRAAKVIGQSYSGVDLILYKNKPYTIELNSAPSLSDEHKLNAVSKAFKKLVDEQLNN
jgi:glutathione synthase/RimK-type ligase-like ATP-grasp enzyme